MSNFQFRQRQVRLVASAKKSSHIPSVIRNEWLWCNFSLMHAAFRAVGSAETMMMRLSNIVTVKHRPFDPESHTVEGELIKDEKGVDQARALPSPVGDPSLSQYFFTQTLAFRKSSSTVQCIRHQLAIPQR